MIRYVHTQKSVWLWVVQGLALSTVAIVVVRQADTIGALLLIPMIVLAGLFCWLFSSLTVRVTDTELAWHFGPGFWKKRLARADIVDVEATRTKWWYGWGIRMTPRGWLYSIYGLDAGAITERSGTTVLIGTDEPSALVAALRGG